MKIIKNISLGKITVYVFSVAVFGISFAFSHFALGHIEARSEKSIAETSSQNEVLEFDREILKDRISILLIGYGGVGHSGGTLADAVMLANIDTKAKIVYLISIPRDTWVAISVRSDLVQNYKLNEAFAIGLDDNRHPLKEPQYKGKHGGGELAKVAVETITSIKPDYYVAIDFLGFERAIDVLGGVEVDVPVTFDDYFYPVAGLENETCGINAEEIVSLHERYSGFDLEKQFTCRYEHLSFKKGPTEMDGVTALKFVRSRHSAQHGGDYARSARQQSLLDGVRKKLLSLNGIESIKPFMEQVFSIVRTDLQANDVLGYLNTYKDYKSFEVVSINLTEGNVLSSSRSSTGQFILIPKSGQNNFEAVHQYIWAEMERVEN